MNKHVDNLDSIHCRAAAVLSGFLTFVYSECMKVFKGSGKDDDELMAEYPVGRLGFKEEGAGKFIILAIPNALKQALLRPAHDWCMAVLRLILMDGAFHLHKASRST